MIKLRILLSSGIELYVDEVTEYSFKRTNSQIDFTFSQADSAKNKLMWVELKAVQAIVEVK